MSFMERNGREIIIGHHTLKLRIFSCQRIWERTSMTMNMKTMMLSVIWYLGWMLRPMDSWRPILALYCPRRSRKKQAFHMICLKNRRSSCGGRYWTKYQRSSSKSRTRRNHPTSNLPSLRPNRPTSLASLCFPTWHHYLHIWNKIQYILPSIY